MREGVVGTQGSRKLVTRNLARIFCALREGSPLTKNEICARLGLSRPTVDRAIARLMEAGFVRQDGFGPSAGGRRAILYTIDPHARYTVGVDLEIPELNIVVSGLDGNAVVAKQMHVPSQIVVDPHAALDFVAKSIEDALSAVGIAPSRTVGLGLGAPAFLQGDTITIAGRNLPHWVRVPARKSLQTALGVPVYVNNDVKFMAIAESRALGHPDRVMAYLALRRGLAGDIRMGGSILVDGKPFHGGNGNAGALHRAYVEEQELKEAQSLSAFLADRLLDPILHLLHLFDPNRLVINAGILGTEEGSKFVNEIRERITRVGHETLPREFSVTMAKDEKFSCAKGGALFALEMALQHPEELIAQP